jgi:hypothetical protein
MTVRARLKYFDSNNNDVVIGSLDDDGGEGIQDLTLKNSAREYSKVIVSGGNGLFGKFPTDSASSPDVTPQENASGPEIFLEVFNQSTQSFEVRDRVFAESQGTVSDNGNFKHKRLYGFEKFVGRQNVDLTGTNSVTSDIEQVLNDALPGGYVADVPSGATVPTVNNYRFEGRRDQVFKDLRENYNFIINFTAETDGSGNYLVKFEPRGFGGIVDTFEKGVDPVFFDKWTKGDELRRITRAEVIGTDSNNNKVSATASTNPDNGRFIRRNIGYVNSNSEAQDIAINLIAADSDGGSPQSTEHGRVTAPIDRPANSNLNASIQILNDEISVDDSFTVVQQKDFFHQSQTQYSFEFEKELESRERRDKKDLGNRNSELITEGQQDVGNQGVTTGSAESNTAKTGGVGDSGDRFDDESNVGKTGGVGDSADRFNDKSNVAKTGGVSDDVTDFPNGFNESDSNAPFTLSNGSFNIVSKSLSYNGNILNLLGFVDTDTSNAEMIVRLTTTTAGFPFVSYRVKTDDSGRIAINHTSSDDALQGDSFQFLVKNKSGSSVTINEQRLVAGAEGQHSHGDTIDTDNQAMGLTDDIDTDNNAMGLTDDIGTDDQDHGGGSGSNQHGGSTESNVNVDVANQDKVNR